MDQKDRQIIRALQRDGRMTNQDLSELVNLSPTPCLRRLRNLESGGAITGYSAKVDAKAYGLPITVFVRIKLEQHDAKDVERSSSRLRLSYHLVRPARYGCQRPPVCCPSSSTQTSCMRQFRVGLILKLLCFPKTPLQLAARSRAGELASILLQLLS